MAMPRLRGGSAVTSRAPMYTRPALGFSSPATVRIRVVFPHPDGPSTTRNSPDSISRSTPATAVTSPKRLTIPDRRTALMLAPSAPQPGARAG